jgi:hypothetical protein
MKAKNEATNTSSIIRISLDSLPRISTVVAESTL